MMNKDSHLAERGEDGDPEQPPERHIPVPVAAVQLAGIQLHLMSGKCDVSYIRSGNVLM